MESTQAAFKPLAEQEIRTYTDSGSFNNGKSYARNDYIYDTTLREATIRGAPGPERRAVCRKVRVTLTPQDAPSTAPIAEYECSCRAAAFASTLSPCCWSGCNTRSGSRKPAIRPRCWRI